jgi:hypothetical protein
MERDNAQQVAGEEKAVMIRGESFARGTVMP